MDSVYCFEEQHAVEGGQVRTGVEQESLILPGCGRDHGSIRGAVRHPQTLAMDAVVGGKEQGAGLVDEVGRIEALAGAFARIDVRHLDGAA